MPVRHHPAYRKSELLSGLELLKRFIKGESFRKLSRSTGLDYKTIRKRVNVAADSINEIARQKLVEELLPEALELFRTFMQTQQKVLKGEVAAMPAIDLEPAKRLFSLFEPKPDTHKSDSNDDGETTLAGFVMKKQLANTKVPKQLPTIDVTPVPAKEVEDAESK